MRVKKCLECGAAFEVEVRPGRTSDYCSPEHKKKAQRRQVAKRVRRFREREEARKSGYKLPA